jgi:hypothetical protein
MDKLHALLKSSGRKFAEHIGVGGAERIDNDPLYYISAERIIRLEWVRESILQSLHFPRSPLNKF